MLRLPDTMISFQYEGQRPKQINNTFKREIRDSEMGQQQGVGGGVLNIFELRGKILHSHNKNRQLRKLTFIIKKLCNLRSDTKNK